MPSRPLCAAIAAAAVLAWPGHAAAKGVPASVRACGPARCVTVTDGAVRLAIAHALARGAGAPPAFGPYLRLALRPQRFDQRGYVVPSAGIVQLGGIDHRLGGRAAAILRDRVAGIAPYRPRVAAVWTGGRRRPRLAGVFAAILRRPAIRMPAAVWRSRFVLVAIDIAGDTPWSGWGSSLYFPRLHVLHVPGGAWMRLSPRQARLVATGMRPPPAASGGAGSVRLVAAAAAAACLLLAAGCLRVRGARRPQASRS